MSRSGFLAASLVAVGLLGACTTLSDADRSLIATASKNAEDAKAQSARAADLAQQALDTARAAQSSATASATAAQQASADAKAANEKADRMFQRTLRK